MTQIKRRRSDGLPRGDGRSDGRHDGPVRRGLARRDLCRDRLRLLLGRVEEAGQDVRPVLGRDHLRQLADAGET
jgi:hypothetical protein